MAKGQVYSRWGKRALDATGASVLLLLLAPMLGAIWLVVRIGLGKPTLFRQERPGWRGHSFQLVKFRTMRDGFGKDGLPLPDSVRLTAIGRRLRSSSLDELPELWNVMKGDMSLVGPRPLLVEYLPLYSARQARRHDVRPGITGWAQVNGRNALTWEKKFEMDVWYVENLSFSLDMKILWKTLVAVVRREGISAAGEATMARFTGSAS